MKADTRKKSKNNLQKIFFEVNEQCRFWKNHARREKTEIPSL